MDNLSTKRIAAGLPSGALLGRQIHYYPSIGSTNDEARRLASAGAPEGTLVIADEQTTGRGRLQRSWWAPSGTSLLFSLLFRPPLAPAQAQQLTMCAGLAAADAIRSQTGLDVALKWPNDVVWKGGKLGGILTELETEGERLFYAVVGVGLNVNLDVATLPPLISPATSLLAALGHPTDRLGLLLAVLGHWEAHYRRLREGVSPHQAWAARLVTVGQEVQVSQGSRFLEGRATGVDAEGALLLRRADGRVERVWGGDVTVRKG
ncbi:MAG: biotin--[acetyl-CoA-carboxylase] ligase [Anaerolineae bacterium]|nr:biotin--[acetyl-CoA-carboxylase] ligase [Anaerolineae bacterium]